MSTTPVRDVLLAVLVLQAAVVVWYAPYLATDYASSLADALARLVAVATSLVALGYLSTAVRATRRRE